MTQSYSRRPRTFLPDNFEITDYDSLKPYLDRLLDFDPETLSELNDWLQKQSEVDAYVNEEMAWRYINYTRFTDNEEYANAYSYFVKEVQPKLVKQEHEINKKLVSNPSFKDLPDDPLVNFKKQAQLALNLYREENIPLEVQQTNLSQKYASIIGAMSVDHGDEELTMPQASKLLQEQDRALRKSIYTKINERRLADKGELDNLFDELTSLRNQQAKNCGFDNYRDFKHSALGRFDYSVEDVLEFHQAIAKVAVPLHGELQLRRKEKLGVEKLKPYDGSVNIYDSTPLKPFETGEELLDKSIRCFERIDPFFGETLRVMKEKGFLDLVSRKGKAPGGYNYPLDEHGIPFIFMNASGSMRDVTTMVHEGGHAVHSMLSRDLTVNAVKHCPSEVSELASMSMELISMDTWDEFFKDKGDLLRAKIEQLEGILEVLPWIATVDKFQHWIHTHQSHTSEERDDAWISCLEMFSSGITDYSEYDQFRRNMWQKQLHIFEVPFYYIEYGIAQLGAIAIWKNYKENPELALNQYKAALSLGYTQPIGHIYKEAGIEFSFTADYIEDLLVFVKKEHGLLVQEFEELKAMA